MISRWQYIYSYNKKNCQTYTHYIVNIHTHTHSYITNFWNFKMNGYTIVCLFTLFDYVPVNKFSVISGWVFLVWISTKQGLMSLAQGHNKVTPVMLELATPQSRVKHSTTEPLLALFISMEDCLYSFLYFFCRPFVFLCLKFIMLSCLFTAALWSPAGKGLTSWLFVGDVYCIFVLILYVPSTIFQLNRDGTSWVEPELS